MNQLLEALLGTLGYVGSSLDKPGATVRGLLGGQGASALANLIPFSDTMGITDPEQRMSGRGLLEHYGGLDQKGPDDGFGFGDILGMGVEAATDPLQWGGLAKLGSMVKGNRVARASNEIGMRNRMHNLNAEELVSKGAMPPEIAALTKARDETGPVATYHGTPHAFDRYDMAKMDPEGLYGPAIYSTVNSDIANTYPLKGADGARQAFDWGNPSAVREAAREAIREEAQSWKMSLEQWRDPETGALSLPDDSWAQGTSAATKQAFQNRIAQLRGAAQDGVVDPNLIREFADDYGAFKPLPAPQNVRKQFLDLRNPFDADQEYGHKDVIGLLRRAGIADDNKVLFGKTLHEGLGGKMASPGRSYWGATGDDLWNAIQNMLSEHPESLERLGLPAGTHSGTATNDLLRRAGYDSITHMGGGRAGGGDLMHRVYLAFSPDQVYQPLVAPGLKSVPPHMDERSLSPLLAALAGENALSRTYPQGA